MNAKQKQIEFIKTYLKPTLKSWEFKTIRQTWWKDKGDFFILINLQNFSWNTLDQVNFCFNIGIVIKSKIASNKKPQIYDLIIHQREDSYLGEAGKEHLFRNKTGYFLNNQSDITNFHKELKSDFETHILPELDKLTSLQDCIDKFGTIPFFGERLINAIKHNDICSGE